MRSPSSIRPKSAIALPTPCRSFLYSRLSLNSADGFFVSCVFIVSNPLKKIPHHRSKGLMFQQKGVVAVCRRNQMVFHTFFELPEAGNHLFSLIGGIEPVGTECIELNRRLN